MGWPGVHERIHCRVLTNIYLGPWDPGAEPAGCQAAELPLHSVGAPGTAAPWQGWESAWPASCLPAWVPGEEAAHRGRQTLPFALPVSQSTHIFHVQQTVNSPSY